MNETLNPIWTSPPRSQTGLVGVGLLSASLTLSLLASTGTVAMAAPHVRIVSLQGVTNTGGQQIVVESPNAAETLRRIHTRSGLSWAQLSFALNVSRRSVHKWAAGGAITPSNFESVRQLSSELEMAGDTTSDIRAAATSVGPDGTSLLDRFARNVRLRNQRPEGFSVDQLVGALRSGDVTVQGKLVGFVPLTERHPE